MNCSSWVFCKVSLKFNHLINIERERWDLSGRGSLGNKWGFLKLVGRVRRVNVSPQSSFCSSDTTKSCPNPSRSPGCCQYFFFSSIDSLKNSEMSNFTFSNNEVLTPWFINCKKISNFIYSSTYIHTYICFKMYVLISHVVFYYFYQLLFDFNMKYFFKTNGNIIDLSPYSLEKECLGSHIHSYSRRERERWPGRNPILCLHGATSPTQSP